MYGVCNKAVSTQNAPYWTALFCYPYIILMALTIYAREIKQRPDQLRNLYNQKRRFPERTRLGHIKFLRENGVHTSSNTLKLRDRCEARFHRNALMFTSLFGLRLSSMSANSNTQFLEHGTLPRVTNLETTTGG